MLDAVRDIYRQSKKKRDNFWTEWISRPPAAVLVYLLKGTSATPNQVFRQRESLDRTSKAARRVA